MISEKQLEWLEKSEYRWLAELFEDTRRLVEIVIKYASDAKTVRKVIETIDELEGYTRRKKVEEIMLMNEVSDVLLNFAYLKSYESIESFLELSKYISKEEAREIAEIMKEFTAFPDYVPEILEEIRKAKIRDWRTGVKEKLAEINEKYGEKIKNRMKKYIESLPEINIF